MTTFELNGLTYITSDEYMKMLAFIPQSVFYSDNKTLFNGKLYYKIKTSTFLQIKKKYDKHVLFNTKLEKCAELNNKGIRLEKDGKIDNSTNIKLFLKKEMKLFKSMKPTSTATATMLLIHLID